MGLPEDLRENSFSSLAEGFASGNDARIILDRSLKILADYVSARAAVLILWDERTGQPSVKAHTGLLPGAVDHLRRPGLARALLGSLQHSPDLVTVTDIPDLRRYDHGGQLFSGMNKAIRVGMSIGGHLKGVAFLFTDEEALSQEQRNALGVMARIMAVGVCRLNLEKDALFAAEESDVLHQIGFRYITQIARLDEVLKFVVERIRAAVNADCAIICQADPGGREIHVRAASGCCRLKAGAMLRGGEADFVRRVILTCSPVKGVANKSPGGAEGCSISYLAVPLRLAGRTFGAICVGAGGDRQFSYEDYRLLARVADQTAGVIDHREHHFEVMSAAVQEERDRIGRELHDGLAQVLGYMILRLAVVQDLVSSDKPAEARLELQQIKEVAKAAYADVREGLLNLRTDISPNAGFVSILKDYINEFNSQSGIKGHLDTADFGDTDFGIEAKSQLMRIIQESLTNVRKHAQASVVNVTLERFGEVLRATIEDDGIGFILEDLPPGRKRFGLSTMRERAESVGGFLEIRSEPGAGTKIVVCIPLKRGGKRQ